MTKAEFVTRLLLMGFGLRANRAPTTFTRSVGNDHAVYDVWLEPRSDRFTNISVALDSHASERISSWYYRVPKNDPDPYGRAWAIIEQYEHGGD